MFTLHNNKITVKRNAMVVYVALLWIIFNLQNCILRNGNYPLYLYGECEKYQYTSHCINN